MNTENNNYELFVNEENKGWAYLPTESIVVMYVSLNKNIQSRGYRTEHLFLIKSPEHTGMKSL